MPKIFRLLAAVACAGVLAACGGVDSPSQQAAIDFNGVLDPGGEQFTTFSVSKTGEMQLTLQSLTPRPVLGFLSMAVGQPSGTACTPILNYIITQVAIGQQYPIPQITKGTYCLTIADANLALTQPASFSIRLLHP